MHSRQARVEYGARYEDVFLKNIVNNWIYFQCLEYFWDSIFVKLILGIEKEKSTYIKDMMCKEKDAIEIKINYSGK